MRRINIGELNINQKPVKEYFSLELFGLVDGSNISLPVALISNQDGPIVTIIAAQHGNEWNGSYVADTLYNSLILDDVVGRIIILPIANPPAFLQKGRVSSFDYIDMNRTFGFVKRRKPTEHLAKIIFEEFVLKSDYLVDLHSGGPGQYLPIVEVYNSKRIDLALSFNLDKAMVVKKDVGSIILNAEKNGVQSFSIEAGRALKINYDYAELLLKGLTNFLKATGVLKSKPVVKENQTLYKGKTVVPSTISGFFKTELKLGQKVKKGDVLAKIKPFFKSEPTEIINTTNGTVIYLRYEELISEGESIVHIAY
ncbi:MAG: hypothetical protein C4562_00535 [Actinobacteria bacterium]|nr:MAG: hypothetical protein C4562_00535 [Actinomycetota bacterium]